MHVFGDRTVDVTFLQINQAASYRMTHQPVVYAALDEDLSAELFPESEDLSISFNGGLVEIRTFTLFVTGQFGIRLIAFESSLK